MRLRKALERMLAGWQDDLPPPWRAVLGNVELCFESRAFDREQWPDERIIPGRQNAPVSGAPAGAHVFRALDGIDPAGARAIILGQEPYPNAAWATGRAFEQGDLTQWPEQRRFVADSLARIIQVLAFARTNRSQYIAGDRAWSVLIRDAHAGRLRLESPPQLFEHLNSLGVLLLNTSLTLSLAADSSGHKQRHSHFPLWRPLVFRVLEYVATRRIGHAIFLLWGKPACDVFERAGVQAAAERAGTWKTRVDVVRHFHPAAITRAGAVFLQGPNPFVTANRLLEKMRAAPIEW